MATVNTFYFDGSGGISQPFGSWSNQSNAFNGSVSDGATTSLSGSPDDAKLVGIGTNATGIVGVISQVRLRVNVVTSGVNIDSTVFSDSQELGVVSTSSTSGWTSYTTLNPPTGGWTLEKLQDLRVEFYAITFTMGSVTARVAQLEVTSFLPEAYWVGGTGSWNDAGNWSATSGGSGGAGVPDENTDVIFDVNSFSSTSSVTMTTPSVTVKSLECSAVDNSFSIGSAVNNRVLVVINDVTLSANLTQNFQLIIDGDSEFNPNGVSEYNTPIDVAFAIPTSGNVTLTGDLTTGSRAIVNQGSLNTGGNNVNCSVLQSQGSSSHINITDSEITFGNDIGPETDSVYLAEGSFSHSGSKMTISRTGQIARFSGRGRTYNELIHEGSDGLTILGSNTFSKLELAPGTTNIFTSGTTQTITTLDAVGTEGNLITIKSSSTTQHNLLSPSGRQNCDYLDIQNSNAGGDTLWFAGSNSVDSGGN